jgi:hypothetical protein
MSLLPRFALVVGLAAGLAGFSGAVQAAPISAAPVMAAAMAGTDGGLLQEVRWAQRCRPVTVRRRDRSGRLVRIDRQECRRVWVGPGRGPRGHY